MSNLGAARWLGVLLFLATVLAVAFPAHAGNATIGIVKISSGTAEVLRGTERMPASSGFKLLQGDVIETAADGRLGLVLRDDSLLSLGPSSRIAIAQFVFLPAEDKLGFTARFLRGTVVYLSGLIAKLAPEATTFVTPVATIGVRGTHLAVRVGD